MRATQTKMLCQVQLCYILALDVIVLDLMKASIPKVKLGKYSILSQTSFFVFFCHKIVHQSITWRESPKSTRTCLYGLMS